MPDTIYVMKNPEVADAVQDSLSIATEIIEAYGGDEPKIHITSIEDETAFELIHDHVRNAITEVNDAGGSAAVDITPGRKFMSAIAFIAGMQYEADHVYYFYLSASQHYGRLYPNIPRSAVQLIDFREVFA